MYQRARYGYPSIISGNIKGCFPFAMANLCMSLRQHGQLGQGQISVILTVFLLHINLTFKLTLFSNMAKDTY